MATGVRRFCILYPDGSVMILPGNMGEGDALAQAREECRIMNKGERDPHRKASFGEITVDLVSFKERF